MTFTEKRKNPFTVQTPEGMIAKDTVDLFVNVFTDFPKIPREGHVFLHGPRGSGKSMMFRYLQPDCQCLAKKCGIEDLDFFGVYVPIKNTDLKLTDLQRLEEQHASVFINEHFITTHILEKVFESLPKHLLSNWEAKALDSTKSFFNDTFLTLLSHCGHNDIGIDSSNCSNVSEYFELMQKISNDLYRQVVSYLKRISFQPQAVPYTGPLCGYLDLLHPLLCALKKLPFMPNGPMYLLIDDADNLSLTQTRVLNTWVSTRTSSAISIKISTQMRYKTYQTVTGQFIECPHDYSEANISTVYTASAKAKYKERLWEIVSRRLMLAQINASPEEFFPVDKEQEKKIKEIADNYKSKWEEEGRGYRPHDDAYRYARPDYIKGLGGTRKSTHIYRYAGFEQLVHISSGVVRNFLEAAAMMFSETLMRSISPVVFIPPSIQDEVVRRLAEEIMYSEFEKMRDDQCKDRPPDDDIQKLENLIRALGGTFYRILISDRAERRVFSIAVSGKCDDDVRRVLKMGGERGYFHVSSIGNKDGTGRTPLYILSRRLAPYFNLDPSSFAGYLFITNEALNKAMTRPDSFLRSVKSGKLDDICEPRQLELFE